LCLHIQSTAQTDWAMLRLGVVQQHRQHVTHVEPASGDDSTATRHPGQEHRGSVTAAQGQGTAANQNDSRCRTEGFAVALVLREHAVVAEAEACALQPGFGLDAVMRAAAGCSPLAKVSSFVACRLHEPPSCHFCPVYEVVTYREADSRPTPTNKL
jgi:hypothetical protein